MSVNEPVRGYAAGSSERAAIQSELQAQSGKIIKIPLIIDGQEIFTTEVDDVTSPHDCSHKLAQCSKASEEHIQLAIDSAVKAQKEWSQVSLKDRAGVFLKAAELLVEKYRYKINAATMLSQSKTVHQAEIDAACELIDFFRFNVQFAYDIEKDQPLSFPGVWNRVETRGLEGFVAAISPFNFTSIAVNLAASPALMGCSVLWKPSSTSALSSYVGMQLLHEAGLPKNVIQFVPCNHSLFGEKVLKSPDLSGVHFTGSTNTFNYIWKTVGENVEAYKSYPRVVGETGGKDFIFAHPSADQDALVCALVRGAFEYQGQKCSAASRAYIPKSIWKNIKNPLCEMTASLKIGDTSDFSNFMGAVIDERAFDKIASYIDHAKNDADAEIISGGECDKSKGYFISPTIILAKNSRYKSMVEEIFGPVLSIYVYDDDKVDETLEDLDTASPYALTGAIFAKSRLDIAYLTQRLKYCAGNFYVNDKPTGAVVGQQPFGGSRASGTNDKAGSKLNLQRWCSMRTIKETMDPPTDYRYPYMDS